MSGNTTSKNLGQVSAVITSAVEPTNRNLLWYDTNFNPPKKKSYDNLTESWIEVIFLPSPANLVKKLIVKIAVNDDPVYLQDEDVFIKTLNTTLDSNVNLPLPNANLEGKSFKIVNYHTNKSILLNQEIITFAGDTLNQVYQYNGVEIVCSKNEISGGFSWFQIASTYY